MDIILTDKPHAVNVSLLTARLAECFNMDKHVIAQLSISALYHDVGKVAIPAAFLDKKVPLTDTEYSIIKTHTYHGYALLIKQDNSLLRNAASPALLHHERLDGTGYIGLKGEEITLPIRIIAVADVFGALSSARPYRPAWPYNKALAYFHYLADKHFDRRVVNALAELVNTNHSLKGAYEDDAS